MANRNQAIIDALAPEQNKLAAIALAHLEALPEFVQLRKLNDIVVDYGGEAVWVGSPASATNAPVTAGRARVGDGSVAVAVTGVEAPAANGTVTMRHFGYGQKTRAVEEVAVAFLEERGYRASSAEMLPAMDAAGIPIGGKSRRRSLASFLSTNPRFDNVQPHGYGLVEWHGGLGPKGLSLQRTLEVDAKVTGDHLVPNENEPPADDVGDGSEAGQRYER